MTKKFIVTFAIPLYEVVVPYLEINGTHALNSGWTPHVRIHEVWQLLTNSCLRALCVWLVWSKGKLMLNSLISLIVTGGFLVAFSPLDTYGGSMKYLDGSETTFLGFNISIVGFGLVAILLALSIWLEIRKTIIPNKRIMSNKITATWLAPVNGQ